MTKQQETKIKKLLSKLDFEGCIELLNKLQGTIVIDNLIFDRMIELDEERFIQFSLEY